MNGRLSLLRNTFPGSNHATTLKLIGSKSNRSAIGARVTATAGGRKLINEVRSGSTFMSQSDLRLHFGLGVSDIVDSVEIEWPGGSKQQISKVPANRVVTITEGSGITRSEPYRKSSM
jgi:hypothetical protein